MSSAWLWGDVGHRNVGWACESQMKEVLGVRHGLVGLHMRGMFAGQSFAVSKSYPALGGAVAPASRAPRCQSIIKYRK